MTILPSLSLDETRYQLSRIELSPAVRADAETMLRAVSDY